MLDHLRVAITVFRSEITDVSGSASGTTLFHTVRIVIDAVLKMIPRI